MSDTNTEPIEEKPAAEVVKTDEQAEKIQERPKLPTQPAAAGRRRDSRGDRDRRDDRGDRRGKRNNEPVATLYVRNFQDDVTAQTLGQFFEEYGMIAHATVLPPWRDGLMPYGYISFRHIKDMEKVLEMYEDGTVFGQDLSRDPRGLKIEKAKRMPYTPGARRGGRDGGRGGRGGRDRDGRGRDHHGDGRRDDRGDRERSPRRRNDRDRQYRDRPRRESQDQEAASDQPPPPAPEVAEAPAAEAPAAEAPPTEQAAPSEEA